MEENRLRDVLRVLKLDQARIEQIRCGIGGITYRIVTNPHEYILKTGTEERISDERSQYGQLNHSLPLPRLLGGGADYLLLEYFSRRNLFGWIREGHRRYFVLRVHAKAFDALRSLWQKNLRQQQPCRSGARRQMAALEANLVSYFGNQRLDLPIVINGAPSQWTLQKMIAALHTAFDVEAPYSAITHGDPRGDNILVGKGGGFRFVDPRSGYSDWVDDFSFFARLRLMVNARSLGMPSQTVRDGRWHLRYHASFPPIVKELEKQAWSFGRDFAAKISDGSWKRRCHIYIAASFLREIHATLIRKEKKILDPPPGFECFLLGEAIAHLDRALRISQCKAAA